MSFRKDLAKPRCIIFNCLLFIIAFTFGMVSNPYLRSLPESFQLSETYFTRTNLSDTLIAQKNFSVAKKIILTRRYLYTICLGVTNALILFATSWPEPVKWGLFTFGCLIFVFMWFFLKQRRQNISRDAVNIEEKLAKGVNKNS